MIFFYINENHFKKVFGKRINPQSISFLLKVLGASLKEKHLSDSKKLGSLASLYHRILVKDSTSHRLHHFNAKHAPAMAIAIVKRPYSRLV